MSGLEKRVLVVVSVAGRVDVVSILILLSSQTIGSLPTASCSIFWLMRCYRNLFSNSGSLNLFLGRALRRLQVLLLDQGCVGCLGMGISTYRGLVCLWLVSGR